ncbi:hypothetical protein CupriaWKF_32850 [Cupriavidus sp. WKF15]|uniref:hypothetical protein n=1 Tax=Cupriavidus sp. WKF15 TaxID=3032282 RepID=UPI0023E1B0E8|nr:hypothetical protein [Cupriavidus sp. WKF15]WER50374.1 hypothetical protein CupriaWKF_32850 [Cupriavidus sp. WKF15]
MPWSFGNYPSSMKNLPPAVREKAIEIANALLDEGYADGMAIRIAIAQAHRWAARHADELAPQERGRALP